MILRCSLWCEAWSGFSNSLVFTFLNPYFATPAHFRALNELVSTRVCVVQKDTDLWESRPGFTGQGREGLQ